jgi:Ca2+-binding EF-hand superfamily protein
MYMWCKGSAGYTLSPSEVMLVYSYEDFGKNIGVHDFIHNFHNYDSHKRVVLLDLVLACFREADADGDGSITLSEFKSFLDRHGITLDQHFAEIFCVQDADANYELDLEEFKSLLLQTRLVAVQDNNKDGSVAEFGVDEQLFRLLARSFFAKADADKDGLISAAEIQQVLTHYGFEADGAASVFEKYDGNGDGAIDEEEFRSFLVEEGVVRAVEAKEDAPTSNCTIL